MYRTLTDPGYQKATNKHGRRLNKRSGTPMHVMAAFALKQLPGKAGNLTQVDLLLPLVQASCALADITVLIYQTLHIAQSWTHRN
jgi:hypothetical protein